MESHPDRKAYVFDSLSAGPELAMIIDKTRELAEQGLFHNGSIHICLMAQAIQPQGWCNKPEG